MSSVCVVPTVIIIRTSRAVRTERVNATPMATSAYFRTATRMARVLAQAEFGSARTLAVALGYDLVEASVLGLAHDLFPSAVR